jgi:tetratricopeptide (TPR) repeat protein
MNKRSGRSTSTSCATSDLNNGDAFGHSNRRRSQAHAVAERQRCARLRKALRETAPEARRIGLGIFTEGEINFTNGESSFVDGESSLIDGESSFIRNSKYDYDEMVLMLRETVRAALPAEARVLVVSKGDPELLKLDNCSAGHFPQDAKGRYPGYYPRTSTDAIRHLEKLRAKKADYLLFPGTASWWLDHYREFRQHLEKKYALVRHQAGVCTIFALRDRARAIAQPDAGAEFCAAPEASEETLRLQLASALLALGRWKQARRILKAGLKFHPNSRRLLIASMKLALKAEALEDAENFVRHAAAHYPEDAAVNLTLAEFAWHRQDFDEVERILTHVVDTCPQDVRALNELMRLFCYRLNGLDTQLDPALCERFLAHLSNPARRQLIQPEVHLRIAEALGCTDLRTTHLRNNRASLMAEALGWIDPRTTRLRSNRASLIAQPLGGIDPRTAAIASLRSALSQLDFGSKPLQIFLSHAFRAVVAHSSVLPSKDRRSLSAFFTHVGNGFSAGQNSFQAETCYHLAIAAQEEHWKNAGAAAMNLAFAGLARGDLPLAIEYFSKPTRLYSDEAGHIIWPQQHGRRWPEAAFDLREAFAKLKPANTAWPKITVLTPSYNQAAYLEHTLLSVFNQHYPSLEYIVLDGLSSDGSIDILKRYESRLAKLVIARDHGQTSALNHGLSLASGDLILWLNSDDMLGPGALFMLALEWLQNNSDIMAGFCCEHGDHRFNLINLPAATQATFNPECLGDIFDYWLQGHYFYQPEVAFSRRILNKVGGALDESLHYTMDYDFWLRCAGAGAQLSIVRWPIGLFRRHAQQKTADLDSTVIEQARVRDRYVLPQPDSERKIDIERRLKRVFRARVPRVKVLSMRASKIFSRQTGAELKKSFPDFNIEFHESGQGLNLKKTDLLIPLVHLLTEREWLRQIRDEGYNGPVVGWFWDNHHHVFDNYRATADLDVCIPGHAWAGSYLRSHENLLVERVPLCVTQWTMGEARSFFTQYGQGERSDELYGGFVNYEMARKRNRLVNELIAAGSKAIYLINEPNLSHYFGLPPGEKFQSWTKYKVSLCLPLNRDLSQRLFDALLAGQIPLIPSDVEDLDSVIPSSWQEDLPIVRFAEYSAGSVAEAHQKALQRFDQDGEAGTERRHRFVLDNHMFTARITRILDLTRNILKGG